MLLHILLHKIGSAPVRIRKQQNRLIAPGKRTSSKRIREIHSRGEYHIIHTKETIIISGKSICHIDAGLIPCRASYALIHASSNLPFDKTLWNGLFAANDPHLFHLFDFLNLTIGESLRRATQENRHMRHIRIRRYRQSVSIIITCHQQSNRTPLRSQPFACFVQRQRSVITGLTVISPHIGAILLQLLLDILRNSGRASSNDDSTRFNGGDPFRGLS